jgi:integrase
LSDYKKYIDKFLDQSQNTLDVDVLKIEILEYFADIPKTSPARFNHPYQYLHALFEWCAKQDYLPYNPFQKLQLKKVRDEGNVQPAEIKDIQTLLKGLDKHNYTELRDYNIVLLILDTGIRTSELMAIRNEDYDPESMSIFIRPDVAKTSRSRTLYHSQYEPGGKWCWITSLTPLYHLRTLLMLLDMIPSYRKDRCRFSLLVFS